MHDCPSCKVPLHGHEEFCPSCGTKQHVRKEFRDIRVPEAPPLNLVPFIVAFVILIGVGALAAQSTWIGQLMTHGAPKEDPMDKLTMPQARQLIEQGLTQGLKSVNAPCKFSYAVDGKPAAADVATPVNLTVDTTLTDPTAHKTIIDSIKPYMEKALIPTLEMHDSKSRATWTYTVQLGAAKPADSDPFSNAPATPSGAPGSTPPATTEAPAQ